MTLAIVPLLSVERALIHVLRLRAAGFAAVVLIAAVGVEVAATRVPFPQWLQWPGLALTAAVGFALWHAGLSPQRRWRRIGYAFTGSELHVEQGLMTRWHTVVPTARVQHIDIAAGLPERMFGVATLVLHTAGTEASTVAVPGLRPEVAEAIRDAIRLRIGSAEA